MAAQSDKSNSTYTLTEVAQHQSKQSLWIVIRGKVHDVTRFQDDHPGGADVLQDVAGGDGTEAFEYAGHSADAVQKLEELTVGVLADSHTSDGTRFQTTHSIGKTSNGTRLVTGSGLIVIRLAATLGATVFATGLLFVALSAENMKTLGRKDGKEEGPHSRTSTEKSASVMFFLFPALVLVLLLIFAYRWIVRRFPRQRDVWEYPAYFPTRKDAAV
ncbi:hypothetical protein MCOR25_009738 [Pyricularia grisea]|uniref:Cytochrome b5 heme-binding domain-containing protein n=1 Tax=Pyricularia grisea TaxID=148305 RepID=A0A6P8AXP3_PYRGI|nr:hypothetical protein PgNI_10929 [Pyricularia grisea]KAI6351787.1 hypothetical protein MCOR25_009738 [Pyricularia grisea]TLD07056.1 hypothetical protein PgNI_10929 [Pyricularia grisea]